MRQLLLVLVSLSGLFASDSLTWYFAHNLPESAVVDLTARNCFRGTYTFRELSIFTCILQGIDGEPFAQLPSDAAVCVVESDRIGSALDIIEKARDTRILWTGKNEIILTTSSKGEADYPSTCGSRSDYRGAALNVIRIPRQPILPQQPLLPLSSPLAVNPRIVALLGEITPARLNATVRKLSGYTTRQSQSTSAPLAVNEVAQNLTNYGFTVTQQPFRTGYCNNVIAEKRGTGTKAGTLVIVGAHLDDRAAGVNNATQTAPGADDNGSGVAALLVAAQAIFTLKATFNYTIQIVTFCGEEQGLYGSDYMAKDFKAKNTPIDSYYNADMLGYRCATTPILGFVDRSVNTALTAQNKVIVQEYLPNLRQGPTTACCSDQQSFNTQGYPAAGFFECNGTSVVYPQYHSVNDTPDRLDYAQLTSFAQAVFACVFTRAEILG